MRPHDFHLRVATPVRISAERTRQASSRRPAPGSARAPGTPYPNVPASFHAWKGASPIHGNSDRASCCKSRTFLSTRAALPLLCASSMVNTANRNRGNRRPGMPKKVRRAARTKGASISTSSSDSVVFKKRLGKWDRLRANDGFLAAAEGNLNKTHPDRESHGRSGVIIKTAQYPKPVIWSAGGYHAWRLRLRHGGGLSFAGFFAIAQNDKPGWRKLPRPDCRGHPAQATRTPSTSGTDASASSFAMLRLLTALLLKPSRSALSLQAAEPTVTPAQYVLPRLEGGLPACRRSWC